MFKTKEINGTLAQKCVVNILKEILKTNVILNIVSCFMGRS